VLANRLSLSVPFPSSGGSQEEEEGCCLPAEAAAEQSELLALWNWAADV